ncbi:SDR family oxidoreductase [Microbacterium sp. APC 3898]|jgi:NADP-dependent 3-hydroxy acid dehydrogenase YdfG|uniref:SDR family oxidoreductase n=1 Tax=Planococcus notacanthi TaxID=3035188 RepID=A0ABT7ZHC2_9BACL|nr:MULTISPECIES: SDR family oxidoreductase [Terrabacteria group]MBF6632621.1 SDR family oxidoreductase [Planococcus sp. (in: firmicutes)]MDN3426556.1 SDR family oxidoreductase [Planococcus sp. APC 4016]MDN3437812.1 SDR family oxidoreductase [Planococcus sp. APC 3900]MDN3500483.1 SDR family oxidoreductase [Microbacterium sp. APC 3898]
MTTEKTAIITGASSGIGEATAKELAARGYSVLLAARREERLKELKEEIEAAGGKADYQVTDVTSADEMKALADRAIEKYGKIDILVNNAGLMPLSFMNKLKVDEWDRMVDVNIKGVLYGIAAVLPIMEKQKFGHILNVSSVAGHTISKGSAVYSGTKFAVRAISEGLRMEIDPSHEIRVTIVSPGAVATELTNTITDDDVLNAFKEGGQMELLNAQDIANAIAYAVEQPAHVDVNEILIRPRQQP